MRSLSTFAVAVAAALLGRTLAAPTQIVHPGGVQDIVITDKDTINGTTPDSNSPAASHSPDATEQLPLSFVNNFSGSGSINAYVTGLDSNNDVVLLQADGSFYYPDADGSTSPVEITANVAIPVGAQGTTTKITVPDYISSARIWFAVGDLTFYVVADSSGGTSLVEPSSVNPDDPNAGVNWGFVELTNNDSGIYANLSYVDFVGLVLGMELTASDGSTQTALGLQANAVSEICTALNSQGSSDGWPWGDLCMADSNGNPLRVIAPTDYVSSNANAFSGYYGNYIDSVWSQYESEALIIDTQEAAGNVSCTVTSGTLNCDGDNRGYAKPVAEDIFGCNSGPFAIESGDNDIHSAVVPRLCAAFDRSTLLLSGGNVQPSLSSTDYYTVSPTNYYSKIVHEYEIDGKGYAFSYDDVNPSGENQSGTVSTATPSLLEITIGGPSS